MAPHSSRSHLRYTTHTPRRKPLLPTISPVSSTCSSRLSPPSSPSDSSQNPSVSTSTNCPCQCPCPCLLTPRTMHSEYALPSDPHPAQIKHTPALQHSQPRDLRLPPVDDENSQPNLQLVPPLPLPSSSNKQTHSPSPLPLSQPSSALPPLSPPVPRPIQLPQWIDEHDFDHSLTDPFHPSHNSTDQFEDYDDDLAPDIASAPDDDQEHNGDDDDDDDEEDTDAETDVTPMNYFVHNGFRYDGDVFELRPPQERSIASRPERILEHKPALLSNRQIFNRVYSEGTYNARPSSLRTPRRSSARMSTSSAASTASEPNESTLPLVKLDTPATAAPPLPVTRPPSIRPPTGPDRSISPLGLCKTIEAVRQSASSGNGNQNLQGLLAYSAIPVTKISGSKPDIHPIPKTASASAVPSPTATMPFPSIGTDPVSKPHTRGTRKSAVSSLSARVEEYDNAQGADYFPDDSRKPHIVREKRGRSYTTFAKSTPFSNTHAANRSGRLQQTHSASSVQKRTSFWKGILLSR